MRGLSPHGGLLRIAKIVQVSAMKVHFQIAERSLFYLNPDIQHRLMTYPPERGSASKATEQDWKDLEKLIDREYDNFSYRIRSLCHLSLQEYRVSLLVKVNTKPKWMSNIMNTSINNISTLRSRAYLRHFGKKGASSDWDEFIVSL